MLRYIVDTIPIPHCHGVLLHADADVCLQLFQRPKSGRVSIGQHHNFDTNGHAFQLRRLLSLLDERRHVTTSTRIPVLSP
jgi:hypothetical protein